MVFFIRSKHVRNRLVNRTPLIFCYRIFLMGFWGFGLGLPAPARSADAAPLRFASNVQGFPPKQSRAGLSSWRSPGDASAACGHDRQSLFEDLLVFEVVKDHSVARSSRLCHTLQGAGLEAVPSIRSATASANSLRRASFFFGR